METNSKIAGALTLEYSTLYLIFFFLLVNTSPWASIIAHQKEARSFLYGRPLWRKRDPGFGWASVSRILPDLQSCGIIVAASLFIYFREPWGLVLLAGLVYTNILYFDYLVRFVYWPTNFLPVRILQWLCDIIRFVLVGTEGLLYHLLWWHPVLNADEGGIGIKPWFGGGCWRRLGGEFDRLEDGWIGSYVFRDYCLERGIYFVQLSKSRNGKYYHYGHGGRWYRVRDLPKGWYGADPEKMIETSANANASEIAKNDAAQRYKAALQSGIRIQYQVSEYVQRQVRDMVGSSVAFGSQPLHSDHAALACVRSVIREVYSRLIAETLQAGAALVVGSSAREVHVYANHPGVEHYFHGMEGKDVERCTRTMLARIASNLKSRVTKGQPVERSYTAKQLYDQFGKTIHKKSGDFIHTTVPNRAFNTLLLEDSFYNLTWENYADLFNKTGATQAWGYGLLPLELHWADMPPNNLYRITTNATRTFFSYRYGESNGYSHSTAAWSTIMSEPYRSFGPFALVAEVKVRMGPFVIFSITKTTSTEHVSRTIEMPEKSHYVRVFDILDSARGALATRRDRYFSVNMEEAYEAINFALSLAEKSLSPEAVMTMIRRRAPGVSLTTQQLVAPWTLPEQYHWKLAMAAYAYALFTRAQGESGMKHLQAAPIWSLLVDQFTARTFFGRNLFFKQKPADILDRLIINVTGHFDQSRLVKVIDPKEPVFVIRTEGKMPNTNMCELCAELSPKLGLQKLTCDCKDKEYGIKFSMDDEAIKELFNELADTDNDPAGLAAVKTAAKEKLPIGGFENEVKVHYIRGGPGTGKSYIIRALAKPGDLILSPLMALRTDYVGLEDEMKQKYDLNFATPHRALTKVNCPRIFVDEYTLLDYRYLACTIRNTGATEVFLVGDHGQTHLQADHGVPIGSKLDMETLPTHNLRVNFRNPVEVVDLLNKNFGYDMISASGRSSKIKWVNPDSYVIPSPQPESFHRMAFTHKEASANEIAEQTVKTAQGKTFDDVVLYLDELSSTSQIPGMQVVALSRHKYNLTIVAPQGVREALFPKDKFPDGGFPDERQPMPFIKEPEVITTLANVDEEDGVIGQPIPSISPIKLNTYGIHFSVSKWTLYLIAKAIFHLSVELGQGGNVLRMSDLMTTGMLNSKVGADAAPSYFLFLISIFIIRYVTKFFYTYLYWTQFVLALSPFPVDRTDKFVAYLVTTNKFLYGLNFVAYAIYMYRMWCVTRMKEPMNFSWNFSKQNLGIRLDLEAGRYITYRIPRAFPKWLDLKQQFKDLHFLVRWDGSETDKIPTVAEVNNGKVAYAAPCDPHLQINELLPKAVNVEQALSALNEMTSLAVKPNFRNGRMRIADIISPLNRRGNVKQLISRFEAFSVGNGVKFWDSPMQTLGVLAERYLKKGKPVVKATRDQKRILAFNVVEEFFEEHMKDVQFNISEDDYVDAMSDYLPKAIAKHYPAQAQDINTPGTRDIRLHIKQIMKPASETKPVDLNKPGQGISAWHKNAQIILGCGALVIYKKFREGVKDHVVFDNGYTTNELKDKCRTLMQTVGNLAGSTNCIADGKMFDANQDEFTQMIEEECYVRLGASREWVALYMSHRKDYVIITPYARGKAGTEKTSGEPFTLLGNSLVSACISNYIYRGAGPVMIAMKGDDFWKRQVDVRENYKRTRLLADHTILNMKSYVSDNAEFTGYTIIGNDFIDSIPRKFNKVTGHEFRQYEHFTEFQKSLRDWVNDAQGVKPLLVAANAELFNMPHADVETMFDILNSLSHIDRRQYDEMAREYTRYEAALLGPNGTLAL